MYTVYGYVAPFNKRKHSTAQYAARTECHFSGIDSSQGWRFVGGGEGNLVSDLFAIAIKLNLEIFSYESWSYFT